MNKTKNTKPKIAESSEEESDSSPLLSKTKHSKKLQLQNKKVAKNQDSGQSDQEDSVLISQKKIQVSLKTQKSAANRTVNPLKRAKKQQSSEQPSDSSEEKPQKKIIKTGSAIQNAAIKKKFAKKQSSQEEQNEQLQPKKVAKGPATKTTLSLKQARKEQSESSEEQAPNKVRKLQQISKAKSPLQKTIVSNKKKQESQQSEVEDEQSQPEQEPKGTAEQKPVKVFQQIVEKKKPAVLSNEKPTVVQTQKQIDEEGQFEVCVKGLSFYALQNDIYQLFKPVGNLISMYLLTREDGKSKGIAFIKLSSKHSYNQALRLDGTQHLGRDITVQPSLSKQNPNFKRNNHLQTTAEITSATIFVGGLSFATTQQNFSAFFQQAGKVFSARIVTDKQTGKSRGFGYIQYHNIDTAKKAYQTLNNKQLDGKQLRIDNATQKDKPLGTKRGYQKIQLSQIGNNARQGSLASFRGRLEAK